MKVLESIGYVNRNQIRHYLKTGELYGITNKTYLVPADTGCVPSTVGQSMPLDSFYIPDFEKENGEKFVAAGLICNDMWGAAQDVGKALNPLAVEGQIEGSVWMGMGQAISEGTQYVNGLGITNSMLDYRVPTIIESPPIEVGIIESVDPHGPFGAKEAGETSLIAFIPALTNAISDAIGVRPSDLPVTPDRLLQLMEDYQKTQKAAE